MTALTLSVQFDTTETNRQIAELRELLERLPDGLRDSFRSSIADLVDFGFQTELISTAGASTYVFRIRSVALAELCTAALGALDSDIS